ncbi:MAG: lysophospholipid acyltransferase family protein [Draconibacterium sp.]
MEITGANDSLKRRKSITFRGGDYFARLLMNGLRLNRLNKVYSKIAGKEGIEFIDEVIRILEYNIELDEKELVRIPVSGAFIVIANHPYGGLDTLLMIKYLTTVRSDIKVWDNSLLNRVTQVSDYFLTKNQEEIAVSENADDYNAAMAHLENNGVLCIFPTGKGTKEVSFEGMAEKVWKYPVLKFIKAANVPVVPFFFQDKGNRLIHLLTKINPSFQVGSLPAELLSQKNKSIKIRVGNPISLARQNKFDDVFKYGRYLRAKTFCLESNTEIKPFFNYSLKQNAKQEPVIDAVPLELLLKDIQGIKDEYTLFKLKNYTVYCAPSVKIPNVMTEIGRLREITFREVGEGTNQSIDVDEFDLYYNQMFIWDEDENKFVGAYRIGMGKDILSQYGKRGFYLQTLFRMNNNFKPVLNESLELGRSFVVKEYQRKPLPLFLLWKGILYFLLKNPEYRYLIGPVSISNNYSKISKELIIKFIMANHLDWKMATMIKPRNSYKFKSVNEDINILMENMEHDINLLDQTIADLDELNSGLPVLLKKYIKLNAKIIGFNVDPKFNNSLDGFILLDVFKVPENTIESLSKDVNDGSILERFYSNRE